MSNIVTFPGLGLEFKLSPIAFTVFGWPIHWYGIIIASGFLLAVLYCYWRAPRFGVDKEKLMDMLFFAVPLCIIGARAYYVIFNPAVCYNTDGSFSLYRTIAIWDGGLAIYGAVIVAIITVAVYCKVRRQIFWDYADVGVLGVIIGQLVGRWGNFVNVECFGGVTDVPWRMCSSSIADYLLKHEFITTAEEYQSLLDGTLGVHPTFFYESAWNLLGFIILALMARRGRKFSGQTFAGYLIWYGLGRAIIEGLRTDSLYFFSTGIRTSQMVGIVSVLAGAAVLAFRMRTGRLPAGGESKAADSKTDAALSADNTVPERKEKGEMENDGDKN